MRPSALRIVPAINSLRDRDMQLSAPQYGCESPETKGRMRSDRQTSIGETPGFGSRGAVASLPTGFLGASALPAPNPLAFLSPLREPMSLLMS